VTLKSGKKARCQWLTPVILTTQEAEKPYLEKALHRKGLGVAQGVGT
jgi:hypothetical protein